MDKVFSQTQYPDVTVLEALAKRMDLGIEKVCVGLIFSLVDRADSETGNCPICDVKYGNLLYECLSLCPVEKYNLSKCNYLIVRRNIFQP